MRRRSNRDRSPGRNGVDTAKLFETLDALKAQPGALRKLVEQAVARSAVHDVLTRGVPIGVDVAAG